MAVLNKKKTKNNRQLLIYCSICHTQSNKPGYACGINSQNDSHGLSPGTRSELNPRGQATVAWGGRTIARAPNSPISASQFATPPNIPNHFLPVPPTSRTITIDEHVWYQRSSPSSPKTPVPAREETRRDQNPRETPVCQRGRGRGRALLRSCPIGPIPAGISLS